MQDPIDTRPSPFRFRMLMESFCYLQHYNNLITRVSRCPSFSAQPISSSEPILITARNNNIINLPIIVSSTVQHTMTPKPKVTQAGGPPQHKKRHHRQSHIPPQHTALLTHDVRHAAVPCSLRGSERGTLHLSRSRLVLVQHAASTQRYRKRSAAQRF
jgi:hypothetical protein